MKRTSLLILLIGGALISTPAAALPLIDVSLTAGLNHSRVDSFWRDSGTISPASFTDTQPRVTLSASLGSLLGLEIGWADLGSGTGVITIPPPGLGPPATIAASESASVFWLSYAPSVRLSAFELTGKLGVTQLKREIATDSVDASFNDTEVFYGVVGAYWFADTVGIRFDAERIGSDVAQMGISLTIGF